jgi:hypothetical protein
MIFNGNDIHISSYSCKQTKTSAPSYFYSCSLSGKIYLYDYVYKFNLSAIECTEYGRYLLTNLSLFSKASEHNLGRQSREYRVTPRVPNYNLQ